MKQGCNRILVNMGGGVTRKRGMGYYFSVGYLYIRFNDLSFVPF